MDSKMSTQEFEEIYERYKTMLYRIAFTYLKNNQDVQDVLQEVFLKRFYHAPLFENDEHEKYWMIRITINMSRNVLKSFWRRNVGGMDELMESKDVLQWKFSESERELFMQVMSLPDKQRTSIYLHYYEGYSCKEIAEILKCKESAVKMRLKKGREILKTNLEQEGFVCE